MVSWNDFRPPNIFPEQSGSVPSNAPINQLNDAEAMPKASQKVDGQPDHPREPSHSAPESSGNRRRDGEAVRATDNNRVVINEPQKSLAASTDLDVASSIPGFYRVLDLIYDKGSGGLVDKIIIEQDSLGRLINDLRPGAYVSITKVDFCALDQVKVKPIGVYGSKTAIVDFLREKNIVDDEKATALLRPTAVSADRSAQPVLRSGMYALKIEDVVYVIYWPEDTTWDDSCVSSVRKNRITFMRYLTKIADQVVCLISDEHTKAIVWRQDELDNDLESDDDDETGRVSVFEVSKTNEQEEGITFRPGFQIRTSLLSPVRMVAGTRDIDVDTLRPRLARGETQQAIVTATYVSAQQRQRPIHETVPEWTVKDTCSRKVIRLSDSLSSDALDILFGLGLKHGAPKAIDQYKKAVADVKASSTKSRTQSMNETVAHINTESTGLDASIAELLMGDVVQRFPLMTPSRTSRAEDGLMYPEDVPLPRDDEHIRSLCGIYPDIASLMDKATGATKLHAVTTGKYKTLKERILTLGFLLRADTGLDDDQRKELVDSTLKDGYTKPSHARNGGWLLNASRRVVGYIIGFETSPSPTSSQPRTIDVPKDVLEQDDCTFLSRLDEFANLSPLLAAPVAQAAELAQRHFQEAVKKEAKELSQKIRKIQLNVCKDQVTRQMEIAQKNELDRLRVDILHTLQSSMGQSPAKEIVTIHHLEIDPSILPYDRRSNNYKISMTEETYTEPEVRYTLYPLELTQDDRQHMQEDASHVPTPLVPEHSSSTFCLPVDMSIIFVHLLPGSRCMLVTRDRAGEGRVYVSPTVNLHNVLTRRPVKELKRDKIGEHFLLSYDESKRLLAVCGMSGAAGRDCRLQLHTFAFDEGYASLQGMGTAVNLSQWYDSAVTIKHMEFLNGSEELLFVDDLARARIFSLVTQQFRPAMLQLPSQPSSVHSTPDGSCFFAIDEPAEDCDVISLRAYHWSSFASSSEGIKIDIPASILGDRVVTSFLSRSNVYLLGLDYKHHALCSAAFHITRRVTEFTFKEKSGPNSGRKEQATFHNSIIDCHADVWTRFPVVPAIRRETTVSGTKEPRSLAFVSNVDQSSFKSHFAALIDDFERTTRKPIGDELRSIQILTLDHESFLDECPFIPSSFCAGEWLVELLCLIPIHIAVTRDNRFVPLKDGIWSTELERSLLGADVAKIVDSISFGWYESLFQSYMATKPVKVVSSMGEQSVGKSFALNHLVDTSFAGSAMRTTEGVWMSVTPTQDALIVALDFEGVHSIERSAQEDTLLVLFNTAISNLVLFRNNFALSRDITGLFQSFQSSASVLDPEANPMLFQSTLVIIIKDVVESDKNEIKKEFYLKFQQIVQTEQAMNFISRLHRNRLDIIPWPVIESKQFYTLFKAIKKRLDQQAITHHSGAVFLQTMKTLMAKLKVNDWGAMSQNLAAHRAHLLLSLLPKALAFGATEIIPDFEPLTNFDTAVVIDMDDTRSLLYLVEGGPQGQPTSRDDALHELCMLWRSYSNRSSQLEQDWRQQLQTFLDETVDLRVAHVRAWLNENTSTFGSTHADVQQLFRTFDTAIIDLKANVRLCGSQCDACNLSCILGRYHDGLHGCQTDHECVYMCQFEDADHGENKPCGLPAGHPGSHLCDVTTHLCGEPCKFSGKRGCQEACVKMADHADEDHICSATAHECGMPCSLSDVRLSDGRIFTCKGLCRIASDVPHNEHRCDNTQCPINCQLCKRLCSEHDHLHGLDNAAIHLCGQEHACKALCSAQGICQIDTAPQSIEATFTGRHESFQYTKYSQVSKRLQCVVMIPSGELSHPSDHSHDLGPKPFHYCEQRCPDCGYFCTLPLGHTQQEHDTSHGSMSKTKWAVDGPDGTILEVNGRKFASNDDGAPMLCSMYCQSLGRHAHVDWCRADNPANCGGPEHEHSSTAMQPQPNKAKDWITHNLYWKRTGFKDPYSHEDQANFEKCDRMCNGPEHNATAHGPAQPSYCTLPILHPRQTLNQPPPGGLGYISNDGHAFLCRNPVVLRQAFHVIFAIDRSGSMSLTDRPPLDNTPTTQIIRRRHNNRLGAVYSSLQAFWEARHRAVAAGGNAGAVRRDAYTVILFNHNVTTAISHDFNSEPAALLNSVLQHQSSGGTDFASAIRTTQTSMETHWSNERAPVVIFLSDGECGIADETMQDLCRRSIARGKPLSFHAVAFGPHSGILRRMAQIARDVESGAPQDPLNPHAGVPSAYHEALDTVRLAETFLGIADSLAKPRGALFRG